MLSAVSSSHPRQPSGTFILGLSRKHLWATDDALPPRPLDDVAVLDAPTPPSSRGGSLHLRVSGLQERANTSCVALPADVYLTYLTDIDNNNIYQLSGGNKLSSSEATITTMREQHEDVGGGGREEEGGGGRREEEGGGGRREEGGGGRREVGRSRTNSMK